MTDLDNLRILGHIAYKLANAPVFEFPFPHIYVQNIFPDDFYAELLANLPPEDYYNTTSKHTYNARKIANASNLALLSFMNTPSFQKIAEVPFYRYIKARFGSNQYANYTDLRLIRDSQTYKIGPHTDASWKILSYLFYLPPDDSLAEHGTSIYLPNDPSFRCPGGPHYPFERFTRIHTAPFVPNSVLAFFKTDFSFHGVAPITIPCKRDLLLWNLYDGVMRPNGN